MIDAVELYGLEALDDPFREEFEQARSLLDGADWTRGLEELEALAHAGSMLSTICVAGCMMKGWYDRIDLSGAEAWYQVAADAGYSAGHFGLGVTYHRMGRFPEAAQEFRLDEVRDYRPAYNALAYLYSLGEGVPLDRQKALSLWRLGASKGHPSARINLARALLILGYGGLKGRFEGLILAFRLVSETAWRKNTAPDSDWPMKPRPTIH